MAVTLRPITKLNWEAAATLEVREDQREFVAANVWAIAESQFYPWTRPVGIFAGGVMVGFLVYGKDPADGMYWLYRFMIDRNQQRKGYGRAALAALLTLLRAAPDCDGLSVAYQPENAAAEQLYLAAGFVKGAIAPWGEQTARAWLTSQCASDVRSDVL